MVQTSNFFSSDDVALMLLPVTVIAAFYFTIRRHLGKDKLPLSFLGGIWRKRKLATPATSVISKDSKTRGSGSDDSTWAAMGEVTPLHGFDHRIVEPLRIYQFRPKHFLTMALQKTDISNIIHIDNLYPERIKARQDIINQYPGALDCLDSGLGMLNEFYEFLMQSYLPTRYPSMFHFSPSTSTLQNLITHEDLPLVAPMDRYTALSIINRTVEEDFLMLLPSPDSDGYSLQSFIWAYPVGFDPQSKLGMKLRDAHAPVPGYKEKLTLSMDRYFDNLRPGNVKCRTNWAVATNDNLCERGEYHLYDGQEPTETEFDVENCYLRCELQTLFALPKSGGRVLSVHLYLYPLREIRDEGLGEEMAQAVDGLRGGNVPGFWRYKRAVIWGEKVKEYLRGGEGKSEGEELAIERDAGRSQRDC